MDDLLSVMFLLRLAYSGVFPAGEQAERACEDLFRGGSDRLDIGRGHIRYREKLYRVMGHKATASMGAVVAHHQAPLGYVLRRLHATEKRAKEQGGGRRDAFAITLIKRSGGAVALTCPWLEPAAGSGSDWSEITGMSLDATPMGRLIRLRDRFAHEDFSRRAAYLTEGWLEDMPRDPKAIEAMLGYQFRRQTRGGAQDKQLAEILGSRLAAMAHAMQPESPNAFVRDFLAVAEFLAREGRTSNPTGKQQETAA